MGTYTLFITVRLRCGACGRTLDKFEVTGDLSFTTWAPNTAQQRPALESRASLPSPSTTRSYSGPPQALYSKRTFRCHATCGNTYVLRQDRLITAIRDAKSRRRRDIIAGVDV
jgi:hypothetical protein